MKAPEYHSDHHRDLLRGYLLNTLSGSDRARIEEYIRSDSAWESALEDQRIDLAKLDLLESAQPDRDLTQAVLDRLVTSEARGSMKRAPFRRLTLAVATIAVLFVLWISQIGLTRLREAANQSLAANNMKQLGLSFKMYSNESVGEKFPPLAPYDGIWIFDVSVLYPEYIPDISIIVSPLLPDADGFVREIEELVLEDEINWERIARIAAMGYTYASWVIRAPSDVEIMLEGRAQLAKADYDLDMQVGDRTMFRIREGIDRFMITDINNPGASAKAQSDLPILLESSYIANLRSKLPVTKVLYLDGHIENYTPSSKRTRSNQIIGLLLDRLSPPDP